MTSDAHPQDRASTCFFPHFCYTRLLLQLLPTPGLQQVAQDPAGSKQHLRHPRPPQAPLPCCRHARAAAVRLCTAARAAAAGASALPCGVGAAGTATPRLCCSSLRYLPTACAGTAAHRLPRSWAATAALQDNQGTAWIRSTAHSLSTGCRTAASTSAQNSQCEQHMVRLCVWMCVGVCCSRKCSQGRHTSPCMHDTACQAPNPPAPSTSLQRSRSSICTVATRDASCPYSSRRDTTCMQPCTHTNTQQGGHNGQAVFL